jgi:hypothetical protein
MAQTILEQAVDFTRPFVLGYHEGSIYRERVTYPLKSSVRLTEERAEERGIIPPWGL